MLPEKYEDSEAPKADAFQAIFALIITVVWAADTFWLDLTVYADMVPDLVRNSLFFGLLLGGLYLIWSAHKLIFGIEREEAELVDYGVFRFSRHPMYLGIMTIYLGLAVSSLSLATLLMLVIIFMFYNYIAAYEEKQLTKYFGDRYLEYMKRVSRWI